MSAYRTGHPTFGFCSIRKSFEIYRQNIMEHKKEAKFDFGLYQFFCSGVVACLLYLEAGASMELWPVYFSWKLGHQCPYLFFCYRYLTHLGFQKPTRNEIK
jgi:hypothetical protein